MNIRSLFKNITQYNTSDKVKRFLSCKNEKNKKEMLIEICKNGCEEEIIFCTLKYRNERGDMECVDSNGDMLIHHICRNKQAGYFAVDHIVTMYRNLGIDIHNNFDHYGMNVFEIICRYCDQDSISMIFKYNYDLGVPYNHTHVKDKSYEIHDTVNIIFQNTDNLDMCLVKYLLNTFEISLENMHGNFICYLKKLQTENNKLGKQKQEFIKKMIKLICMLDQKIKKNLDKNYCLLENVCNLKDDDITEYILDYYIKNKLLLFINRKIANEVDLRYFVLKYGTYQNFVDLYKSHSDVYVSVIEKKKIMHDGRNIIRKKEKTFENIVNENKNIRDKRLLNTLSHYYKYYYNLH